MEWEKRHVSDVLLRNATLVEPFAANAVRKADLRLVGGKVAEVAEAGTLSAQAEEETLEREGLHVSAGWIDLRALLPDPGYEYREDVESFTRAAAAGGFAEVCLLPDTKPAIQTRDAVKAYYAVKGPVRLRPMAALSVDLKGEEMAELYDLHAAGAVAFTDGLQPTWRAGVFKRALLYLQAFDGLLVQRPEDPGIAEGGLMHEGPNSAMLGLSGIPPIAEEMALRRDLALLEYVGGRLHFANLSAAGSVALVREAKAKGLRVTADVAAHQLAFTDEALLEFDPLYKVSPPLRSEADRQALIEGLAEGVIDCVVSSHVPLDTESVDLEFEQAAYGMAGLETAFSILNRQAQPLSLAQKVKALLAGRTILGETADDLAIRPGASAKLTLFDPAEEWTFRRTLSKSRNSPFIGKTLLGKPLGVINGQNGFLHASLKG